jgi:diguanylate cyclase (GGDEF)-like protein
MRSFSPRTSAHWATPEPPELGKELSLTEGALAQRRALVGLSDGDERVLRVARERLGGRLELVLDRIVACAKGHFDNRSAFSAATRPALTAYLEQLLGGPFDLRYALERVRVGIMHQRGGVEPHDYLAGNTALFEAVAEVVTPLLSSSYPSTVQVLCALTRVLAFDASLVLETYTHAEHRMLEFFATHDTLTQLPNVNGVWQHLEERILGSSPPSLAVLLVGLSGFRAVNETLGHRLGDELLRVIARRLEQNVAPTCLVGRMSGDLFVVVHELGQGGPDAAVFGEHLLNRLARPFSVESFSMSIDANIGIACFPGDGRDTETLLKNAETALDAGRALQKGITFFSSELRQHSAQDFRLMGQLRTAIEAGQLLLHYHPKVETDGYRFSGAEALVRWNHPDLGLVPPGAFIPLAEQTTLIHPVTDWVIGEVCRQIGDWNRRGARLTVAVNLAAANLQNVVLPDVIRAALERWSIPASQLICEITESGFLRQPQAALETLRRLRTLGVVLSLDDFGTGYSSLAYLRDLPIDEIKLDRSFVSRVGQSERDEQIVAHVIRLAHALGLSVVAEGVENLKTAEHLARLGCDRLQGFYFARPLPAADLLEWISATSAEAPFSGVIGKARARVG